MRVLIIGCGYVGITLGIELIRQGHEVFGLRRNPAGESELRAAGIYPLFADITNLQELRKLPGKFDWVINCVAAGGGVETYRQVYLEGTSRLIEWLSSGPPQKFIYTSSTSVYAQNDGLAVDESSPTKPTVDTGKVLVETENLLLKAVTAQNFPAVILRVSGIYGPGRGHWFKQFFKDSASIEGDGSRFLNMIHRDDLAGCIQVALKNGRPGQIYNATDNEPVTQLNFFRWLAGVLGKELPSASTENLSRRRGVTNKQVSNAKLRAEFGYEFRFPDFRAGYSAEILRLKSSGQI
ncbi:MAG: SDR family oxidoreductase [Verrucomicrobiota bacterium]|jgi:nucleoside-diphosphate-sugar epimerase